MQRIHNVARSTTRTGSDMHWWQAGLAVGIMSMMAVTTWANAAPPQPKPKLPANPVTGKLKIVQTKRENYRIVIPQRLMRAALNQIGEVQARELPTESTQRQRTWIAGFAMSAALCSLVLVRRKSMWTKMAVVLVFAGATYAGSQWVYADLGPRPLGPIPKLDEIEIFISKSARQVELQVPKVKVLGNRPGNRGTQGEDANAGPLDAGSPAVQRPAAGK